MPNRRRVRDYADAASLLSDLENSGLSLVEFCARQNVDGRSLNAWRTNLSRREHHEQSVRFVELVASAPPSPRSYTLRHGDWFIELSDDFDDHVVARLMRLAAAC